MTLAEKLNCIRARYEHERDELLKGERNVCTRCGGWGKIEISLICEDEQRARAKNPPCALCGGTGKLRICNSCGSVH